MNIVGAYILAECHLFDNGKGEDEESRNDGRMR